MSWISWGGDDSGGGSDDSWWGYALSAASAYADSEGKKKDKKQDLKDRMALIRETAAVQDEYEQKKGQRIADAYKGYEQYNSPNSVTAGAPIDPLAAFKNRGLMTYGQ